MRRMASPDWKVPDFSTVSQRQKAAGATALPGQHSGAGLDCAGSRFWAKASGNARITGLSTAGSGAKCTWGSMPTHWRFGPSRARTTALKMYRCCRACWGRYRPMRRWPASAGTASTDTKAVPCRDSPQRRAGGDSPTQERKTVEGDLGGRAHTQRSAQSLLQWAPNHGAHDRHCIAASGVGITQFRFHLCNKAVSEPVADLQGLT